MHNLNYKTPEIESCPLEDDEDALWLRMKEKQKLQIQSNNVCPFEEFEDLTEANLSKEK